MMSKINVILVLILTLLSFQAHADNKEDLARLDQAWGEVYENIGWLAGYLGDLTSDGDATERMDTYKALMAVLTDDFLNLVYPDTDRPRYQPYLRNTISNFCAPNTDFKYGLIHTEPGVNYRVWGTRGNAEVIDFQQYSGWPGHPKKSPITSSLGKYAQGTFDSRDIEVDDEGNFEFTFGPDRPASGQWWQAEDDGILIMVRDIFLDHTKEAIPARFYIEKIGKPKAGPTTLPVDEAVARLQAFARSLKEWDVCFKFPDIEENRFVVKDWYAKPEASDKAVFENAELEEAMEESGFELSPGQLKPPSSLKKVTAGQLTQTYHMAFYNVKPGEALIGEWRPPTQSLNWNVHLYTRLLQNLGFIDRQTDINTEGAHLDDDGVVRFVVSHNDPGVANWLDVDGRPLGTLIIRCKLCNERGGIPSLKLVPESEVLNHLPKDTKMITPKERDRVLALRRQHYMMRFHQ